MTFLVKALVIGGGATLVLDLWALLLNRLFGFGLPNWALVGRWVAHLPRGQFVHADIAQAQPVANELALGWVFHYAVGVLFAAVTLLLGGAAWAAQPTWPLPLAVGLITVGCGWFILQPGMGAGIAASKKPDRARIRTLNIVGHIVFGLAMWGMAWFTRG
ncbi:MAG: DUF2938 family protein [Beijerinckiaceae bacterium]